jgi:hypothetical protein
MASNPQIRLITQEEIDALDPILEHFAAHDAAEGYRHATRVLAGLILLEREDGCTITLTDADGTNPAPALVPPPEVETGSSLKRWTIRLTDRDQAHEAVVSKWLGAETKVSARRRTILVMGRLLAELAAERVLWAQAGDGEDYRLVVA